MDCKHLREMSFSLMLLAISLVSICAANVQTTQADHPPATITVAQTVHPVLIRNDACSLIRITISVTAKTEFRLKGLSFDLRGTDDLDDLQTLAVYSTGNRDEFSSTKVLGEPIRPARTIDFPCDQLLAAGKNVFWLACRLKETADLDHGVTVDCTAAETSVGKLPVAPPTASVRHRIGVAVRKHNDEGVHTYRIPALTTTKKGALLSVYDMRRRKARDLQEDIDIGLSRSLDGGKSWEPVRVVMDMGEYGGLPQDQNGCSDPGIVVDQQTGEIFCFAVWMHGKPGHHQWKADGSEPGYEIGKTAQLLLVRSRDEGLTWSKPENLTRALKQEAWWLLAPSPQQGINLPDGTLVMPMQGRDETGETFATIMISQDHGQSWKVGQAACRVGNECQAAQLGDGSIMLNVRNGPVKYRAVHVTKDLGQTWQPHPTNGKTLIEPTCNGSLLRFDFVAGGEKKHLLLFSNPHSQKARTHQTIQVSFDDGQTWPTAQHLLLDAGRGAGYSSMTRVDDQHVGIIYEGSQAHLTFEKVALTELLKQQPGSP